MIVRGEITPDQRHTCRVHDEPNGYGAQNGHVDDERIVSKHGFPVRKSLGEHDGEYDVLETRDIKHSGILVRLVNLLLIGYKRCKPGINK